MVHYTVKIGPAEQEALQKMLQDLAVNEWPLFFSMSLRRALKPEEGKEEQTHPHHALFSVLSPF